MQYRELGKTGLKASVVGLGAEHLDNKEYKLVDEVINAALEHEFNIIDLFMPGTPVRENIGRALGKRRKDVLIQGHIGSCDLRQQYDRSRDVSVCEKYFDNLLKSLNTDYIDLGLMFYIDTEEDFQGVFETPYIDYVRKLKQSGKIRHIGASSHDARMAARVVETGEVETFMFSINLAFDMLPVSYESTFNALENSFDTSLMRGIDPDRAHFYSLCESRGVGITVMKTLGAGKLLSKEHTPFGRPMTVPQCIHYALTRPAVSSALIGCASSDEVAQAAHYISATDAERDFSDVPSGFRDTFRGECVYCNHCQPCPSDIDIAKLTKFLDIARLNESAVPPSVVSHYKSMGATGSECIECGSCEARCPFGVKVMDNMREAQRIFGVLYIFR